MVNGSRVVDRGFIVQTMTPLSDGAYFCFRKFVFDPVLSLRWVRSLKIAFGEAARRIPACGEFAEYWKSIIKQYTDYLKPKALSMTLTGGIDSRMILSAFLNLGIKPNAFTFGNPHSFDGVIAAKLAEHGVEVDKKKILLEEPIKTLGEKLIQIKVGYQVNAEVKVDIVPLASE